MRTPLLAALDRRPYRNIDLMAYRKDKRQLAALFEERGYVLDPSVRQAQEFGIKRFVYEHPDSHLKADVFCDDLVMAHHSLRRPPGDSTPRRSRSPTCC